ncbi:MAG: peptidase signal peptidase [Solirubrobacteraceae bacterium]|nr:peptidase signal peptidase [Solirubrobacteraceae bacterium]
MDAGALTFPPATRSTTGERSAARRPRRGWVANVLLGGAIALAVAVAVAAVFGVRTEVVLTGSMRPAISPDDMVVVHRIAASQMRRGDIVSFAAPNEPGIVLTHRVRSLSPTPTGRIAVETRGDANNTSEHWTIDRTGSVARVIATIPRVGALTDWTGQPLVRILLFAVLGSILLAMGLRRVWSS